jgi:hypothetical protein
MPSGNTAPSKAGHTVAQKNSVKPFRNGRISARKFTLAALWIKETPASVEIAIAPMLIQYGGMRSEGANEKKV